MSETTDKVYPIYHVSVWWTEDGENSEWRHLNERVAVPEGTDRDAGEGRYWNSTGFSRMYREDPGIEGVTEKTHEWWPKYVAEKPLDKNPSAPIFKVELTHHESWCLGWFTHWTFDEGQTDEEARDSFERFVRRMEQKNRREATVVDGLLREPYCLMGAEDRWRWKGDGDSPPPCRCEHCKKQGVLRIGH